MSTATTAKPMSIHSVELHARQTAETCEALLRKIVTEQNGRPAAMDLQFFGSLGWDVSLSAVHDRTRTSLRRELHRMNTVVRLQAVAGSSKQRLELATESERAQSELDERGTAIDAEIERLTKEKQILERHAASTAKRLDEANAAASSLTEHLPKHVLDEIAYRSTAVHESELFEELQWTRSRVAELRVVIAMPTNTVDIEFYCQRALRSAIMDNGRIIESMWHQHVADCQKELEKLLPRLAELEAEHAGLMSEAEKLKNFYLE